MFVDRNALAFRIYMLSSCSN